MGGVVWLLAWVAVVLLQKQTDLLNLTMVLVMASALSALWLAPAVALCASLASGMVFNYVLVPPKGEFALAFDQHHVFLLLTVVALSWIIAKLMAGQRALAAQERLYALRAEQLQGLGEALRDAENPRHCAPRLHTALSVLVGQPVSLWMASEGGPGGDPATVPEICIGAATASQRERLRACAGAGAPGGREQHTGPEAAEWYLPMRGRQASHGAVRLPVVTQDDVLALRSHAQALCDQMGLALERRAAAQAAATAEQQARTQQLRNTLLTAISHDYRTPLSTILGAASALKDQGDRLGPGQRHQLLSVIVDEAEQLARVTHNTLQLARLDSPGVSLHLDWESAEEMVGAVLRRTRQRNPAHTVQARVEPDLPLVRCDAVLLAQMLDNLVDNAFKHGGNGQPVDIVAAREGERLMLSVLDRGPGVPPAWRERVFDVFERVDQPGDATPGNATPGAERIVRRGAGLGLAVCRVIAQVHGGGLTLHDRPGGGSCLACWLPLNPPLIDEPASGWGQP